MKLANRLLIAVRRLRRRAASLLAFYALGTAILAAPFALAAQAASANPTPASLEAFHSLTDDFFDAVFFQYNPSAGTSAGLHQYDVFLEPYSRASVESQVKSLHEYEIRLRAISPAGFDDLNRGDYEFLLATIQGRLLTLETIRSWETNPDTYSSGLASSAFSLIARKFAPPDQRMKSLIAREKQMPAALADARKNLKNPPRIYTEIALEQLPGNISFFKNDVPLALKDVSDPALNAEFSRTNAAVIAALESYERWMRTDLLPRSNGDFRIGKDAFEKKLLYDEMVDTSLDKLLEIAHADLLKNQTAFNALAKEVDPAKTSRQVLEELGTDHPKPDQLLQSFRDTFSGLIDFIRQKQIITLPSDIRPILEETPPFLRAVTFASMDTPGPYESVATEAYFNVTLPEKTWPAKDVEEHMASFNVGTILSTSVHEAYPGHYVQFLWVKQAPSKIRKLLSSSSDSEGWAHYCEQMMLDEGYGQPGFGAKNAREAQLLRLGQLQDALLRDARFIVGIEMHTGHMSFDQGVDFFVRQGYQTHINGLRETKRGTADPTYLYYTLGKLQILKLRQDVMEKEGAAFSLQRFHDSFVQQGTPPIKVVRRALLGNDSPTL